VGYGGGEEERESEQKSALREIKSNSSYFTFQGGGQRNILCGKATIHQLGFENVG